MKGRVKRRWTDWEPVVKVRAEGGCVPDPSSTASDIPNNRPRASQEEEPSEEPTMEISVAKRVQ